MISEGLFSGSLPVSCRPPPKCSKQLQSTYTPSINISAWTELPHTSPTWDIRGLVNLCRYWKYERMNGGQFGTGRRILLSNVDNSSRHQAL